MKTLLFAGRSLTILLLLTIALAHITDAQTATFTYQGKLNEGNFPANGTYEMQFSLFDAATDGTQIGSTITKSTVTVLNGVFTIELDFPDQSAFDGSARWLAIAVKKPAEPSFTPLDPRQAITSAPYAIKALNADTAMDSSKLGGVNASEYIQTNHPALTDAREPLSGSTHYVQNTTTTQPLSNFNISGEGKANVFSAISHYNIGSDRVLAVDANLNTFAGIGAGQVTSGSRNSFFGKHAGLANTIGFNNSFFGFEAGLSNTLGNQNAFFGAFAGSANESGVGNSFFGAAAGLKNTKNSNSFFGQAAGQENFTGQSNSFFGAEAGRDHVSGIANVFIGRQAGLNNLGGAENTFVGANAGSANVVGNSNTLLGAQTSLLNGVTNATAVGANTVVNQSNSLVLGNNANVGIGTSAPNSKLTVVGLIETTTGGVKFPDGTIQTSAFQGPTSSILNQTTLQAGANFNVSGTGTADVLNAATQFNLGGIRLLTQIGNENLIVGKFAGAGAITGSNNTFVGPGAGNVNTTGHSNSFFGSGSGWQNVGGTHNVFVGKDSGKANIDGSNNTFVGISSGLQTDGNDNTFIGGSAGMTNTGFQNTFLGSEAGRVAGGTSNTYLGYQAGEFMTGSSNTMVGDRAGDSTANANNVTLLGRATDVSADNLEFATAIGAQATVGTSNTIVLGRSGGQDKVRIPGLGSAGATSLCRNANNEISTCSSSLRYKSNVSAFTSGLDVVNRLKPITFDWKQGGMRDLGLGAEDVAAISELLVIRNPDGQVEGVKYDRVGVVLLNAVKEQQAQIDDLKKQIEELKMLISDPRRKGGQK